MKQKSIINHVGPFGSHEVLSSEASAWIKFYYDYTCLCCGKKEPEIRLVIDHIVPKSKRGPHTVGNAQPLCVRCNAIKGTKAIDYRTLTSSLAGELAPTLLGSVKQEHHITYQHQYRKCGKIGCSTCYGDQDARGHGPYWYAYWRENGRVLSAYAGSGEQPSSGAVGSIGTNAIIGIQNRLF